MLMQRDLGHAEGEIIDLYLQDLIFFPSQDIPMNLFVESDCHGDAMYSKCIEGWWDGVSQRGPGFCCDFGLIMSFLSHRDIAVMV